MTNKFKVGDRVRLIESPFAGIYSDDIQTITEVIDGRWYHTKDEVSKVIVKKVKEK